MIIYEYNGITESPDLESHDGGDVLISGIKYDIANSDMSDKDFLGATWHQDLEKLYIEMDNSLSGADEIKLDTISGNY